MRSDLRASPVYREVLAFCERALVPGFGRPTSLIDARVAPDGQSFAITASMLSALDGAPELGIYRCAAAGGACDLIARGARMALGPAFSPDGSSLAFLADEEPHVLAPRVLLWARPEERRTFAVAGNAEALAWHPDSSRLYVLVAGAGAEQSTAAGGKRVVQSPAQRAAWVPEVDPQSSTEALRRILEIDLASGAVTPVTPESLTVWEFTPLGNDHVAFVGSEERRERGWYHARLYVLDRRDGHIAEVYRPAHQVGCLLGAADGTALLFCESLASDPGLVAGALRRYERGSAAVKTLATHDVDVSAVAWIDSRRILVSGLRDLATVIAVLELDAGGWSELLASEQITSGILAPAAVPVGRDGDFLIAEEGAGSPPALLRHTRGARTVILDTAHAGTDYLRTLCTGAAPVRWRARDGLELAGWLLQPATPPPWPLVTEVHGGPVSASRPQWHGRLRPDFRLWLREGFAVFMPNFRGSRGRGLDFAMRIVGDMGGEDGWDVLAGIDELVRRNLADPKRLAISGGSYGGFAACWLPCLDPRFRAAIAVSPVTNWLSQHYTSNIPHFDQLFLAAEPGTAGPYVARSPVFNARAHRTPTLLLAGGQDRATRPEQAHEFEQTLRELGIPSELAVYPLEGHGIRTFPAIIDAAARTLAWLRRHVLARPDGLDE
jgi:dipeptidyl aminopeptidase/acylaminoacyl peptidase